MESVEGRAARGGKEVHAVRVLLFFFFKLTQITDKLIHLIHNIVYNKLDRIIIIIKFEDPKFN